jgi:hypothetical protein
MKTTKSLLAVWLRAVEQDIPARPTRRSGSCPVKPSLRAVQ